jgi:hypothetical protein
MRPTLAPKCSQHSCLYMGGGRAFVAAPSSSTFLLFAFTDPPPSETDSRCRAWVAQASARGATCGWTEPTRAPTYSPCSFLYAGDERTFRRLLLAARTVPDTCLSHPRARPEPGLDLRWLRRAQGGTSCGWRGPTRASTRSQCPVFYADDGRTFGRLLLAARCRSGGLFEPPPSETGGRS